MASLRCLFLALGLCSSLILCDSTSEECESKDYISNGPDETCPEGYHHCRDVEEDYNEDKKPCCDINECGPSVVQKCGPGALCNNTCGSYICPCNKGYQSSSESHCVDIDECNQDDSICGTGGNCINVPGNYYCTCKPGFGKSAKNDKKLCRDINECSNHSCGQGGNCTNYPGSYSCTCLPGYFLDVDVGPRGEKYETCKAFTCPVPSSSDCSDEQNVLNLLDEVFSELKNTSKEKRHRMATELMERMESLFRGLALTLPKGLASSKSSKGTELAMEIRTAGSQSPVRLSQNNTEMELSRNEASREEAPRLTGLISYQGLGPILTGAHIEGLEWKQRGKTLQRAQETGQPNYQVLSSVAAAFVDHEETKASNISVNFTFSHMEPDPKREHQLICAFWKTVNGSMHWATEGCTLLESLATTTRCHCNHLTSFAVLMAFYEVEDWNLDVITKIGLIVSLVCLFLSILTFLFCRPIRGIRTSIHLHLCLALFAAYVIFLMGAGNPGNKTACAIVAGLLHYFFLSAFCWMLLEGVELYLMVVQVFKTHALKHWHLFLVGYGLPAIVVGISASVYSEGYGTNKHCWLSLDHGFLWSFSAPVCLIIMVNAIVFVITVWRLSEKFADISPDIHRLKKLRILTITAIAQLCILGTTWIFGIFQFSNRSIIISYIFTILNSLQGLFIFLLHCLLKKQVRDEYHRWFCRGRVGKSQSSDKYSDFSSSAPSSATRAHKSSQESGM